MSTAAMRDSAAAFRDIVGADYVVAATPADAIRGVVPQCVVEPADAGEVARVLRAADDLRLAVVPRGGGTKLDWGNRPARADVVLSTRRLDRIVDHPWADLTLSVEAGCTIEKLQSVVSKHGQRVAADPLWPSKATVGGVLSTNDTGAWRLRFGGLRDLVIGTTLALTDGTLARSGGKVVKNVAGYDLSKLATGALGTLGVITTAIFRLHPVGRDSRTLTAAVASAADAQRAIDALLDSKLVFTALQLRATHDAEMHVDALFEGSRAAIDDQIRQLPALASVEFGQASASVWTARETLWNGNEPAGVVKIATLPSEIGPFVEVVRKSCAEAGEGFAAVIEATGIGWMRIACAADKWVDMVSFLRRHLAKGGGSAAVLKSPQDSGLVDAWGDAGDALPLMQAVKTRFDPHATLNPGRFVGGI
jgi:glycolate oxidase FAD binding subunit